MTLPHRFPRALLLLSLAATALSAEPTSATTAGPTVSPADNATALAAVHILAESCDRCHGPLRQKGHLRLDSRAAILSGGEGGPAITPGNPDKSPLITAVRYQNEDFQMPPDKPLEDAQVATLVAWVKTGAPWPTPLASATHADSATIAATTNQDPDASSTTTHTRPPLIGRVHPLVVHFPIACLLLAALAEAIHFFIGMRKRAASSATSPTGWENAVAFLVLTGAAGAVVAVATGTFFPDDGSQMFHRSDPTMRTHELLGWLSMIFAVSAAGYLFLSSSNASRWPLRILLLLAAAVVGLTGHLGGAMVYGEHFLF